MNNCYLFVWAEYAIEYYELNQNIFDSEDNQSKNKINLSIN